ncbi:hypothetical protein ACS0TY_006864 [Phlomoides rotata]
MSIDLSHNSLQARIPPSVWHKFPETSFFDNPNLRPPSDSKSTLLTAIFVPVASFLVVSIMGGFIYYIKRSQTSSVTPDPRHGDIFKIWNYDGYEDVIQSTADFDLRYCIEAMEVFTGRVVAVKKLHRFEGQNPTYDMCFRNEAKVLSEIRHRNIVKLFGFSLHNRCMFLIYDYMERGRE